MDTAVNTRPPLQAWLDLAKVRLNSFVLFAVGTTFHIASVGRVDWLRLVATVIGAGLTASASSTLNMVIERDFDALMHRTMRRPIPSGQVGTRGAIVFGLVLAAAGIGLLLAAVGQLAALIGLATLVSYLFIYTPLKRKTTLNTIVGAVPGALPVLLGWAGARGRIDEEAWALAGVLFLWQIPHFLAIARLHRDDYERGGFRMLPVVDPDGFSIGRQAVLYSLAILPLSLVPVRTGLGGWYYCGVAIACGLLLIGFSLDHAVERGPASARRLFLASLAYLPPVWITLMLDKH